MASIVLQDAYFQLNGVDLSAYVRSLTLTTGKDTPEDTAMGDTSRSFLSGLKNGTITVEFNEDDAAGAVSATLWSVYTATSPVAWVVKPNGSVTSTTNPAYSGSCIMTDFTPVGGAVGDTGKNDTSLQITGDVTRATS